MSGKLEAMQMISDIPKLFFTQQEEALVALLNSSMDYLDKLHLSCHEVTTKDAHKFYQNNPYMHECVDQIIHGVNSVRTSISSIPKARWHTIGQEEQVVDALEEAERGVSYCLDQFRIKDL